MEINFWDSSNMSEFWQYVRMLLETAGPGVMIVFAITAVGFLIRIIVKAFRQSSEEDDDYEIEHY